MPHSDFTSQEINDIDIISIGRLSSGIQGLPTIDSIQDEIIEIKSNISSIQEQGSIDRTKLNSLCTDNIQNKTKINQLCNDNKQIKCKIHSIEQKLNTCDNIGSDTCNNYDEQINDLCSKQNTCDNKIDNLCSKQNTCDNKIDNINNCLKDYCKKDNIDSCYESKINMIIEQKMCLEVSLLKNCLINMIESKMRTLYIKPEDINDINNRIHNMANNIVQLDQTNKTFQTWATNHENKINDLDGDYNNLKNTLLSSLLTQST